MRKLILRIRSQTGYFIDTGVDFRNRCTGNYGTSLGGDLVVRLTRLALESQRTAGLVDNLRRIVLNIAVFIDNKDLTVLLCCVFLTVPGEGITLLRYSDRGLLRVVRTL